MNRTLTTTLYFPAIFLPFWDQILNHISDRQQEIRSLEALKFQEAIEVFSRVIAPSFAFILEAPVGPIMIVICPANSAILTNRPTKVPFHISTAKSPDVLQNISPTQRAMSFSIALFNHGSHTTYSPGPTV